MITIGKFEMVLCFHFDVLPEHALRHKASVTNNFISYKNTCMNWFNEHNELKLKWFESKFYFFKLKRVWWRMWDWNDAIRRDGTAHWPIAGQFLSGRVSRWFHHNQLTDIGCWRLYVYVIITHRMYKNRHFPRIWLRKMEEIRYE